MIRRALAALKERAAEFKVIYLVLYAVTVATGVVAFVTVPAVLASNLGDTLSRVWSCMFIVGALGSGLAVVPGWWWVERMGIVLVVSGALFYFAVVVYSDLTHPGSEATQIGTTILAAAVFYPVRWLMIRGFDFEPRPDRG